MFSSSTSEESMKNDWFIDSGCSNHMCGKKEMFSDLDESFHASVRFGNNEKVPVLGKGKIRIILQDGSSNFISDVFYVPSLYHNLLSLGQLSEKGYDLHFKYGDGTISDEKLGLIAKVKMNRSRLWPLSLNCGDLPCFNSMTCDDSWLWHMRFGHLNFGSLKFLARKKLVVGLIH